MEKKKLKEDLANFADEYQINTKGPLCMVLVVTRAASKKSPPFSPNDFLTPQGGQLSGLGRTAVQSILADYNITRVLAEEGGRTSRGNIRRIERLHRISKRPAW